ncbi:MAG: DUF4838 domain-containing protein [Phycisphaeraceae bacterium]|nr:DUF4838 domain-containing protein [Phycisphaeraceae bacterium]
MIDQLSRLLTGIVVTSLFATLIAAPANAITLVKDGRPAATLVIAARPTRAAQLAAYELQWHIQRITGAMLPITTDNAPPAGPRVLIGDTAPTRQLGVDPVSLHDQEYLVQFFPDALVLIGCDKDDRGQVAYWDRWDDAFDPATEPILKESYCARATFPDIYDPRGTLNAVYDLLERHVGVRWFRPGEFGMEQPRQATLDLTGPTVRRSPGVRYMEPGYGIHTQNIDASIGLYTTDPTNYDQCLDLIYGDMRRRCREKGGNYTEARRREGHLYMLRRRCGGEPYACCHSITSFYARFWEKYESWEKSLGNPIFIERRPAYFAQGYEGKPGQLCYANPDVVKQTIEDARNFFDHKGPKLPLQNSAGHYFAVVPEDNSSYCKCPTCQARMTHEPNAIFSNGQASDYVFQFVNQIARGIAQTHPDKWISTLAYADYAFPPRNIRIEPNVTVQMCLHVRNNWCPKITATDGKMLDAWAGRGVPLYLWLYDTFPVENATGGGWHCFPGFFAHDAARSIKRYIKAGARGVFFNGIAQDVDMYLTYRLLESPELDADEVLDDYWTRFYGQAAEPMKQLYQAIEETFSNPQNYPPDIASGEKAYHQTEEIAWKWLGTADRMERFGKLMEQAKAAARTEKEKARVAVFELSIWRYMVEGRRRYLANEQYKTNPPKIPASLVVPALASPVPGGDPNQVDWTMAAKMDTWHTIFAEPCDRKLRMLAAHDDEHLYLSLSDEVDPATLKCQPTWEGVWAAGPCYRGFVGDSWRVLVSRYGGLPYESPEFSALMIPPTGPPIESWRSGAKVVSDLSDKSRWTVRVAMPLKELLPGGTEPGCSLLINVIRHTPEGEAYAWRPMLHGLTRVNELGYLHLDIDHQKQPAPTASAGGRDEIAAVDQVEITKTLLDDVQLDMATNDLLEGRPFAVEPQSTLVQSLYASATRLLTDARSRYAPTQDLFLQPSPDTLESHLVWTLDPVPSEGRQLRQIRVYVSAGDGCRLTLDARFAVRDAGTGAWRDITKAISETFSPSRFNRFCRFTITFPPGQVAHFDAIRMTDLSVQAKRSPARLVEVDAIADAPKSGAGRS